MVSLSTHFRQDRTLSSYKNLTRVEALILHLSWWCLIWKSGCDWVNPPAISVLRPHLCFVAPGTAIAKAVPADGPLYPVLEIKLCRVPPPSSSSQIHTESIHHSTGSLGTLHLGSAPFLSDVNDFIFCIVF